eukprot:snap_masked-scaffold18_size714446-processed-gene-1.9 protein:Tk08456 transcript:snap_masked-scaffold18_size714446-processed-gene-1.9-mRNA-1 annotation:"hypothetical protein L798_12217"
MSESDKCNLNNNRNESNPYHIKNSYGGIPQNLITNLILLSMLLITFLILRKSAWKVVNRIVKKDDLERWTHVFFSFTDNLINRGQDKADGGPPEDEATSSSSRRLPLRRQSSITETMTFGQWLASIFTSSDDDIEAKCGTDARQYVRFIRYIIIFKTFVVILSIGVILPLNFQGTLQGDETSFEHTTLVNLDPSSDLLWVHVVFSFIFFPLAIVIMRKFSVDVAFQDVSLEISRTLMIDKVPRYLCQGDEITRHFAEAFPNTRIKEIRFAYDVEKLKTISDDLAEVRLAKQYCERNQELDRPPITLYPVQCSRCCSCCCCCCVKATVGLEYYGGEEARLSDQFETEKDTALKTPLGIVFLTFQSVNMSKQVFDAHRRGFFSWNWEPPQSTLSTILKPKRWKVSYAPNPDDIYWENLSVERRFLLFKKIVINIGLFIITFFLTTPEYLVSQTDYIVKLFGESLALPSGLVDFLPTIMLWGFTAFMPLLVSWSDRFLGHWTRSAENHAIMKKTFWYLLFMVVFLPTFGFTTAQASFNFIFNENTNDTYRWECVFLPDSGAFFVNYIITTALVGAGLELIRFPELFFYTIRICWSKSEADLPAIRQALKYEFRFGEQYARMMLILCMTMMYSLSCPLIVPFGWLYFVTRYYVDRHNLLYVYKPSKINKEVHSTAISFVVLSTLVLLFFMTVFTILRSGSLSELTLKSKVEIVLFLLAVNIFSAQLWSDTCKKFSPIDYIESTYLREDEVQNQNHTYLPDILKPHFATKEPRSSQRASMRSTKSNLARDAHTIEEVPSDYVAKMTFPTITQPIPTSGQCAQDTDVVESLLTERAFAFANFASRNGLVLNAAKTQLMVGGNAKVKDFASLSVVVECVVVRPATEIVLLGVTFDTKFTTLLQEANMGSAARQRGGLVARLAHHMPRGEYLRRLASGLVLGQIGNAVAAVVPPRLANDNYNPSNNLKATQSGHQ